MKRLIDILKKKRQWRQIGAVVLIVCLLGSVLLSNQISGVRAIPDEEKDFWSDASPSNAKHTPDNTGEKDEEWALASGSNATVSNASPSNAEEYDQLTLEDDSEPVMVSGKLPIGTSLKAQAITEEELQDCGLEEVELNSGRPVFAYDISLWLHGKRYEPEYALTVQIDNTELLGGKLKLLQIDQSESEPQSLDFMMDKEGRVRFTMKKLAVYAGLDMSDPDAVITVQDPEQLVAVTGILPKDTTVTVETLSEKILGKLQLPEGDITFAYDITLWVDGKEYQPEQPVKVKILHAKDEYHEDLLISHVKVEADGSMQTPGSISGEVEADGSVSFLTEGFSYFIGSARMSELQLGNVTWTYNMDGKNGPVTLQGDGQDPGPLNVALLNNAEEALYTGDKTVMFAYSITAVTASENPSPGVCEITVSDRGVMSDDDSVEIYKIQNDKDGQSASLESLGQPFVQEEGKVAFLTYGLGNYIAVSNVATVDLAKGNVTINPDSLAGTRQDGRNVEVSFGKNNAKYRIAQSNATTKADKGVTATGNFTEERTVILDGINTDKMININAPKGATKKILLQLRGTNQVKRIGYGTGGEKLENNNVNSSLTIDSYASPGSTDGELYIPKKMESDAELKDYVSDDSNGGSAGAGWAEAGIGGFWQGGSKGTTGLTISGGTICVITSKNNCATAIGGGANADGEVTITGGDITAICCGTGAAIGGGIGWEQRGGNGKVTITGGTVYAENYGYFTRNETDYGGVAIGSGSSKQMEGNAAVVEISGDSRVTAYARYGNAIGSGNSYDGTAAQADITISGNSYVLTNALGGGTSKSAAGGSANIRISEEAYVECVNYSNVTNKYDPSSANVLGAFGIGGGGSRGTAKGGSAIVEISGGTVNCNGGKIGGGSAENGAGGDASVTITGGKLDCASIGGGDSENGTPGAVTKTSTDVKGTEEAGIVIAGGSIKTGTIGGGKNGSGAIGFATAKITGGEIQGQFVLANRDKDKKCSFEMTGGTIDNRDLSSAGYERAQENGGAVYLDDANGTVSISGGTIKNAAGVLGGAVYMKSGSFTLSGNAAIENCIAKISAANDTATKTSGCGGAVYLEEGTVSIYGGYVRNNQSERDGAGVYLANGSLTVSGGMVENNTAKQNGGGAYLQSGTFSMGDLMGDEATVRATAISGNHAENGAGVYLAGGTPDLNCGTLSGNTASGNGGGIYIDKQNVTLNPVAAVNITGNNAANGAGIYIAGTEGRKDASFGLRENCKGTVILSGNTASGNGGAVCIRYGSFLQNSGNITITGNKAAYGGGVAVLEGDFQMSGGAIGSENGTNAASQSGGGVYVSGGSVTLDGGTIAYNTARMQGGGIAVKDGNVLMYDGSIVHNKTSGSEGGGIYINADQKEADVTILSGTISNNTSHTSGGAIAVLSTSQKANIVLGTCQEHAGLELDADGHSGKRKFEGFDIAYDRTAYSTHHHTSCPVIADNTAGTSGGAFYVNGSSNSVIAFYCLHETGNKATGESRSDALKVEGGTVKIGDESYTKDSKDAARGNVAMTGSMLIEGGTVTISGSMKNPYFENRITVDSQKGYVDNRVQDAGNVVYRVIYMENFTGTGTEPTGLYITRQYSELAGKTVAASLFGHGGWTIQGWNTKKDGSGKSYSTGTALEETGISQDNPTLTLYAIWQRNMYTVVFHPNIPLGVTYSGMMENLPCTVGDTLTLPENVYRCTGYQFDSWNTKRDGSGTAYSDRTQVWNGLSQENGATINLYAQWSVCLHPSEKQTYRINETKKGLIQTCSCGAHTAEIIMEAVHVTYDKNNHPVKTSCKGDEWIGAEPNVAYSWRPLNSTEVFQPLTSGGLPQKAGQYRAEIEAGPGAGTEDRQNIWINYRIEKAKQEAAEGTLKYAYDTAGKKLVIDAIAVGTEPETDEYHSVPVYELEYTANGVTKKITQKSGEQQEANQIYIEGGLPPEVYCRISAYYGETDNYLASGALDAGFYTSSNAQIHFTMDQGVTVEPSEAPSGYPADSGSHRKWYRVKIDEGYHKNKFQCSVKDNIAESSSGVLFQKYEAGTGEAGDLYYLELPATSQVSQLEVEISVTGVLPNAGITVKRAAGPYFDDFDGIDASDALIIGADSVFTAQFGVSNRQAGEYGEPYLKFGSAVPAGTTIIMQTLETGQNTAQDYWYYKTGQELAAESILKLSAFQKMGADSSSPDSSYSDLTGTKQEYRFVVDFTNAVETQTAGAGLENTGTAWNLVFTFTKAENNGNPLDAASGDTETVIPDLWETVTVMKNAGGRFTLETDNTAGLDTSDEWNSLNLTAAYHISPSDLPMWTGRTLGLVIAVSGDRADTAPIPRDMRLEVQKNGGDTTLYPQNENGEFLVPLDEISKNSDTRSLTLRLVSDTYYFQRQAYQNVTAKLYASASADTDASFKGKLLAEQGGLTLVRNATALPSVKVETEKRLYPQNGVLKLPVTYANVDKVEATIWKQNENSSEYTNTAFRQELDTSGETNDFSLNGQEAGSYCLKITASKTEGESIRTIMEVPYYFIITNE